MADHSPDSNASGGPAADHPVAHLARSCHACNRKKVRCDKLEPSCTPCLKAGGGAQACEYPPVGPRKRRTKKTIMQEMSSRISSLEKSLAAANRRQQQQTAAATAQPSSSPKTMTTTKGAAALGQALAAAPHTPPVTPATTTAGSDSSSLADQGRVSRDDLLVSKGFSSQHFDDAVLSKIISGDQSTGPRAPRTQPLFSQLLPASSPFNPLGILSTPVHSTPPAAYHPSKPLAMKLWKLYVDSFDAFSQFKLLHKPTDEVKVYTTIDNPATAPMDHLALNYVIYYSALVTVVDKPDAPLPDVPHASKPALLHQFKLGLEQSLAHASFLDHPSVTGLQALVMYLAALRVHNRGKGIWILNGFAIRVAQSLGLHRDGARLGLCPFEAERRRRLWWQLLCRDSRAGEDYGLENTTSPLLESDVALPLNVDDAELYPGMTSLPAPRRAWNPITITRVAIDLAKATQQLAVLVAASSPASSPPSEPARAAIVAEAGRRVDAWLALGNPVVPHYRQATHCAHYQLSKLDFATRLQWGILAHQHRSGGSSGDSDDNGPAALHTNLVTEERLTEALDLMDRRVPVDDVIVAETLSWCKKSCPQYHILMYVMWHLSVRPEGPNVERAWATAEELVSGELEDEMTVGLGSKWALLSALKAKALAARQSLRKSAARMEAEEPRGDGVGMPDLVGGDMVAGGGGLEGLPSVGLVGDEVVDDMAMVGEEWPNWATLVQGFQLNDVDEFW